MLRFPGRAPRLKASEINKWNRLADQQARGELEPRRPSATSYDPSSRVVICKNTSGEDRQRFECMSISGLLFDPLETDGSNDVVFELDEAAADESPAILKAGFGRFPLNR